MPKKDEETRGRKPLGDQKRKKIADVNGTEAEKAAMLQNMAKDGYTRLSVWLRDLGLGKIADRSG